MWRLALAALLAAHTAAAATWTCTRTPILPTTLVAARCTATGTYTTGGESLTVHDLCGSDARVPAAVFTTAAISTAVGQAWVTGWNMPARTLRFGTAGPAPGQGEPLVELAGGSDITGAASTLMTLCE